MYLRVCSIAGDPAGRGPIATTWRRCSHARLESNFGVACPDSAIENTTMNAETAEHAHLIFCFCELSEFCVDRFLMTAYRVGCSPDEWAPCRSALVARFSAPRRAASPPT